MRAVSQWMYLREARALGLSLTSGGKKGYMGYLLANPAFRKQFIGVVMPSRRMKSKTARKIRQARKGKARKRAEQNKGTTPKFPIHID